MIVILILLDQLAKECIDKKDIHAACQQVVENVSRTKVRGQRMVYRVKTTLGCFTSGVVQFQDSEEHNESVGEMV